ncbi:MAG: LCP family protein [Candidatus Melainabacteria bacterium]|nr:LCP family protein [Candidatus Melainabacteria bacterium]
MNFQRYPKILYKDNEDKASKRSTLFYVVLFFIGLFLTIVSLNIYSPSLVPQDLRVISLNKRQNILILGCDEIFPGEAKNFKFDQALLWKGRSDTIFLISCNPFKNTLNILNIPRDTRIKIPGHGVEKINYLNSIGGPRFTKKYLERLLRTPIHHYVVINVQGLSQIIDEIGGIKIDVPQRMFYEDHAAKLYINLFPGKRVLNGEQVVGYLRFRHDNLGDIGRIQRQQAFMRAVFDKLLDPVIFTKLPELTSIYKQTILTDLKPKDIIRIANFVRNVSPSKQNIVLLPGEFGQHNQISYWIPNPKEIDRVIKQLFYDKENNFNFLRKNPKDIKISIFNGSRKNRRLATKLTNILREYGYTVLQAQDYESYVKFTKIYAQKANSDVALQIKNDIGNRGELLIGNLGPPEADVTILAGDDLANIKEGR